MRFKLSIFTFLLLSISASSFGQSKNNDDDKNSGTSDIPTINIDENSTGQDEFSSSSKRAGSTYISMQDPFLYTSAFTFYHYNFKPRGSYNYELLVNGAPIQNIERGITTLSQINGVPDVLHNQEIVYGLNPSSFAFGGLIGSRYINATAADQRQGTIATYTFNEQNYGNRIMLTHNSGLMKNGWAYSVSAAHRWGDEVYRPGTFTDGYSFYGAISKVIRKSQFNLTAFGAPSVRGGSSMATQEAYQLAKDNQYNATWGYQDGKVRNAKVYDIFQPAIIANYTYKPSDRTKWNTAVSYEFGKYKRSGIDYYNAYSPDPDYYRNLPSYYDNLNPSEPLIANAVRAQLLAHPEQLQVDWNGMYNANYINTETVNNVNGIAGNNVTGLRSLYVMSNIVDDLHKMSFNTNVEHNVNGHLTLYGGLKAISQDDQFYKQLTDLMGGSFYVNYNQFANQQSIARASYMQNDLNNPNQLVKVGDIYGYNVKINVKDAAAWGQSVFTYDMFNFFAAANLGYTSFSRDGLMRNGLNPDNSYGTSPSLNFLTYKVKAGALYKLDLRNSLYVNAEYAVEPPSVSNTYISFDTKNYTVADPHTAKATTYEGGYLLQSPKFNARITGYVTNINDATSILRFYNDDPSIQSYVQSVLQGVSAQMKGVEFSGVYKINHTWSISGFVSEGKAIYTNSPFASVYQDNLPGSAPVSAHQVYISNYNLGNGPQSAYSLGIHYRPANRWTGRITFNYMDNNYVAINPDRRTQLALDLVPPGSVQWNQILKQEKLPSAYTVDASIGKTFNLDRYVKIASHKTQLVFNLGVINALNNTDIRINGYEQLRYDYANRNVAKYPNYYDYAFGINFYANISLRF